MKSNINHIIMLFVVGLFLFSCKKEGEKIVLNDAKPTLSATAAGPITLLQANGTETALIFKWDSVYYGFSDALTYTLQISPASANFKADSTTEVTVSKSALTKVFTVAELNTALLNIMPAETTKNISFRLKSNAGNVVSNVISMNVKTFEDWPIPLNYPLLYTPGDYQGWKPDATPIAKMYSVGSNKQYEGSINMLNDSNPFKFTATSNWDSPIGSPKGGVITNNSGTLWIDGGSDNLVITGKGYYKVTVDLDKLTWAATLSNWGIIGSAANGWGNTDDIPFDFDATTQTLYKVVTLKAGAMKFRTNNKWDVSVGDPVNGDKEGNIAISVPGTYKILFDVRIPSKPYWKLIKQ